MKTNFISVAAIVMGKIAVFLNEREYNKTNRNKRN